MSYNETAEALREVGVSGMLRDEGRLSFDVDAGTTPDDVAYIHLVAAGCSVEPHSHARVIEASSDQLPALVEEMIDALHLSQVLMFPIGKWQSVFDAVAFSLASNDSWREVDALATVRLHTRDPLLCSPGDYQTIRDLLAALFSDAETSDQGITITSTAKPFIAEIIPEGCVKVMVGSQVLADEIVDSLHFRAES